MRWLVRPTDEPKNLGELLKEKGFEKLGSNYKMGLDLKHYEKNVSAYPGEFEIIQGKKELVFEDPIAKLILNAFPRFFLEIEDVKRKFRVQFEKIGKKREQTRRFYCLYQI